MSALLTVENISVWRGDNLLLNEVSFELNAGEVLQIRGANGSGKTTLLRMVCGLGLPDEGVVKWRGKSIERNRDQFNEELLYLGHKAGIKGGLTALENLRIFRKLANVHSQPLIDHSVDHNDYQETSQDNEQESDQALLSALDEVSLSSIAQLACRHMSAGQQRRVSLARLVFQSAPLWVLDEPLTSLDKAGLVWVAARIAQHVKIGGAVLLTTHAPLQIDGVEVGALELT